VSNVIIHPEVLSIINQKELNLDVEHFGGGILCTYHFKYSDYRMAYFRVRLGGTVLEAAVNMALALRLYGLYERNKKSRHSFSSLL